MKVQADVVRGVYKVVDFDTDAQVIDDELFYGYLAALGKNEIIAATLRDDIVAKITKEYGIA